MFLQHLKGCENTRFLYSEFTGGVVDDYAFSCIYGHFRDRQRQHRWNLNRSDAVIVDAKPLFPYAVDLLRQLLLLVLIPPGHFCEAVIGELAGNIVLILRMVQTCGIHVYRR